MRPQSRRRGSRRSKLAPLLDGASDDPNTPAPTALAAEGALALIHLGERPSSRATGVGARDGQERACAYALRRDEALGEGIRRVARGQLDLTIGLIEHPSPGEDGGKAVHDARKALKRLRALLRVSRGTGEHQQYRREDRVLRDVGRALSASRDSQVLLDTLDGLSARYSAALRDGVWSPLRASLVAELADAGRLGAQRSATVAAVLSGVRERVTDWSVPESGGPDRLGGGFADVYRAGRAAHAAAAAEASPERLHELRKRAKDLWHAAQLLGVVAPDAMKALQREAHRLSDLLGDDHDLTILREHVARRPELLGVRELELLAALSAHRQRQLRDEALAAASELYRVKPKKLLRRLSLR